MRTLIESGPDYWAEVGEQLPVSFQGRVVWATLVERRFEGAGLVQTRWIIEERRVENGTWPHGIIGALTAPQTETTAPETLRPASPNSPGSELEPTRE